MVPPKKDKPIRAILLGAGYDPDELEASFGQIQDEKVVATTASGAAFDILNYRIEHLRDEIETITFGSAENTYIGGLSHTNVEMDIVSSDYQALAASALDEVLEIDHLVSQGLRLIGRIIVTNASLSVPVDGPVTMRITGRALEALSLRDDRARVIPRTRQRMIAL